MVPHLGGETRGICSGILHLRILHEEPQQGHVSVTGRRVQSGKHSFVATEQVLDNLEDDLLVLERDGVGLEQASQRSDEDR
jgi:hypothetical protein